MPPLEVEVTLAILSRHPVAVVQQLVALKQIGAYSLIHAGACNLRDVYFDTQDFALDRRMLGLRIREQDEQTLITLKGPSRILSSGALERSELELPWSKAALEAVIQQLATAGIGLPGRSPEAADLSPVAVCKAMGLRVVQDRETHRHLRNVVPLEQLDASPIAEMAIDTVAFELRGAKVRHHEVEIEAKTKKGSAALSAITTALLEAFPNVLRPWKFDKLVLGMAIEQLVAEEGRLDDLLDSDSNLRPEAYAELERRLERHDQTGKA